MQIEYFCTDALLLTQVWRDLNGVVYRFEFVSCLSHDSLIPPLLDHLSPKGESILYPCPL